MTTLIVSVLLAVGGAEAATGCEAIVAKASAAQGEQVAATFAELARCDAKLAEKHFPDFMRASTDVGTLVDLSVAAIDAKVYQPVWTMMEKVPDIGARAEVAKGVGAHCVEHPAVLPFVEGAYSALSDRQFAGWREALGTCEAPELVGWLESTVGKPPSVPYDEKYNAVADAFVKAKRAQALPALEKAAIAAGATGPFSTILDRMADAARPATFGGKASAEDQKALEDAFGRIAAAVGPEQARLVADRLYQNGAEVAAAALLPRIYPDRVQGGKMLYGVAAVESCAKEAVVHFATVTEPAKRWSIVTDVTPLALGAFKPRLKCDAASPWPVMVTPEPVASKDEVEAWVAKVTGDIGGKGVSAATREEKPLTLP